ncbi:transglycosylase domain-containing protein [Demequina soli]|uniref:transglycosylase domain-containing protein n=1 Tax=Demequina soli TaxID=1638987 RepID=UPI000783C5E2|nr:transglycosylase domain-containing protein [Demequina soli]
MTERPLAPQRVSMHASSTSPQPPRSGQSPVRRSTRSHQGGGAWASTGVAATPASSTGAKGGGQGGGGGKGTRGKDGKGGLPRWKRILRITGIAALIALLVTIAAGAIAVMSVYSKLEVPQAADVALAQSSTVYWADGKTEMAKVGEVDRQIIDCSNLPDYVPHAIVASEDRTFYTNPGIDFKGTARALYKTIVQGDKQGGSTITQQYVERYYVGETTTDIPGKIKEALLALKVDSEQTKDEVLCNYMNTIYLGRGAYGIEAAAQAYFDKHAEELTLSEAAMIWGIVPAPSAWDPAVNPAKAEQRWNYVLDGMVEAGFITQAERDAQAFPEPVEFSTSDTFGGTNGYLIRTALDEAIAKLDLTQEQIEMGGYKIVTTFKKHDQRSVVNAVQHMPEGHADNLKAAATTVNAQTGAVTAMYGGPDYLKVQRNAVTQDISQAGSTFKPFAMIAALSNGFSLDTRYEANDSMTLPGFENPVRNFAGINYGWIDMVQATQNSVNTYYVQLNEAVGPDKTMQAAIDAGLPQDTVGLDDNAANVLGTASPTAMQMAHAYTTIADGGVRKPTYTVQKVIGPDGGTAYEHQEDSTRVFSKDVIADTTYAMQQVVQAGSATQARELGRPIAGKTGTSNDNKSAWFCGFTPQIVGVVSLYQVGEDGSVQSITPFGGYSEITGGTVPTDIWVSMMGPILDRMDVVDFPPRANVGEAVNPKPTSTPSSTPSPTPSSTPSPTPSQTAAPEPSVTPEPVITPEPSVTPEPVITPEPSSTPEPTATAGAAADPAATPGTGKKSGTSTGNAAAAG